MNLNKILFSLDRYGEFYKHRRSFFDHPPSFNKVEFSAEEIKILIPVRKFNFEIFHPTFSVAEDTTFGTVFYWGIFI